MLNKSLLLTKNMDDEIDELCKIYDLVGFKRYEEIVTTAIQGINDNPLAEEFRFRRMEGQRVIGGQEAYYDCFVLKPSCSRAQIPNLSGAEGFNYEGTCGRESLGGILNSEKLRTDRPTDIRVSKVTSHEDLWRVFVRYNSI